MLRFDDNAADDDRISFGEIPRELFFKTYKEGVASPLSRMDYYTNKNLNQ